MHFPVLLDAQFGPTNRFGEISEQRTIIEGFSLAFLLKSGLFISHRGIGLPTLLQDISQGNIPMLNRQLLLRSLSSFILGEDLQMRRQSAKSQHSKPAARSQAMTPLLKASRRRQIGKPIDCQQP